RNLQTQGRRGSRGAFPDDVTKQFVHYEVHRRSKATELGERPLVDRPAKTVFDGLDDVGLLSDAIVGKHRIRCRKVLQGRLERAEINGRNVRDVLQARTEGKRSYRRSRGILPDANGHGVPRTNQTEGGGLQSLVLSIRIFRGPVSAQPGNVAFLDRGVVDQRSRSHSPGESCGVDKRFERGANLPLGEQGAVVGTLLEIPSSDNCPDPAGFVVDSHQGSLDVGRRWLSGQVGLGGGFGAANSLWVSPTGFRFQGGELRLHGVLRDHLKAAVDGGVNF